MTCQTKHTDYQPTENEFVWAHCKKSKLTVTAPANYGPQNCELLHQRDWLVCFNCAYGYFGETFTQKIIKKAQ